MHNKNLKAEISFLIVMINVLISFSLVTYAQVIEYFVASPLALSEYIKVDGRIPVHINCTINSSWNNHANDFINYPGSAIIIFTISDVTSINDYQLIYLPITVVFYVIILLCFFKLFFTNFSYINLLLFSLASIYIISMWPSTWNLTYHSIGYLSHILFLYVSIKLLIERARYSSNRAKYIILLLLLHVLSLLNYYSTSVYNIIFTIALAVWTLLLRNKEEAKLMFRFSVLLLIMYVSFDYMMYQVFRFWKLDFISLFEIILSSIQRFIKGKPYSERLYAYGYPYERNFIDIWLSRINLIFMVFFPIIILFLTRFIRETKINRREIYSLIFASLSVAVFESIPYSIFTGGISFRYFSLFTPTITISLASFILSDIHVTGKRTKKLLTCSLIIFILTAAIAGIRLNIVRNIIEGNGVLKKELVSLPQYMTLARYAETQIPFFSNFQVSAELRLASIKIKAVENTAFEPFGQKIYQLYDSIIHNNIEQIGETLKTPSMLVFTYSDFSKPIYGSIWGNAVPPLGKHNINILGSKLSLVYSSGKIMAFYVSEMQ